MNDLSESFVRKLLSVQDVAVNKPSRLGQFLVNRPQKNTVCVSAVVHEPFDIFHLAALTQWSHSYNEFKSSYLSA